MIFLIFVYSFNMQLWSFMNATMVRYAYKNIDNYNEQSNLDQLVLLVTGYLFGLVWSVLIFLIPMLSLFFYALFGSSFFLFAWTDNVALWSVTKFVPGASLYHKTAVTLFLIYQVFARLVSGYGAGLEFNLLVVYLLMAVPLEFASWYLGVNAARRLDPTWNERRGMLYPPILYWLGLVEDEGEDEVGDEALTE